MTKEEKLKIVKKIVPELKAKLLDNTPIYETVAYVMTMEHILDLEEEQDTIYKAAESWVTVDPNGLFNIGDPLE